MSLKDVLTPIVNLMEQCGIPYALIGGYAVAAWGELRATRDIDLLCSVQDVGRLKATLELKGYTFEHRTGDPEDPISDVIRIETSHTGSLLEIDVRAGIRSSPPDLLRRSLTVPFEEMELKVAGPEDMIILKLLAGSPMDLEDARGILRVQKEALNRDLLARICPAFLSNTLAGLLQAIPLL